MTRSCTLEVLWEWLPPGGLYECKSSLFRPVNVHCFYSQKHIFKWKLVVALSPKFTALLPCYRLFSARIAIVHRDCLGPHASTPVILFGCLVGDCAYEVNDCIHWDYVCNIFWNLTHGPHYTMSGSND